MGTLIEVENTTQYLLIHARGNDLTRTPLKVLKDVALALFAYIDLAFPGTKLIWSQILPRDWGDNQSKVVSAAKRLNTFIVKQVKLRGGFYIHHTHTLKFKPDNFLPDGVHLSSHGSQMFINNIRLGLEHFLNGTQPWF